MPDPTSKVPPSIVVRMARLPHQDAVTVLTAFLALLYVIPSDRTIGGLGGAGSPSALFALAAGLWWCWYQLARREPVVDLATQPVRLALTLFVGAVLASYIVAMLRPLSSSEVSGADLGLIRLFALASILLVATDLIPNMARLRILLHRLVVAGALLAALGLVQFATGQSFVSSISIPGLSVSQDFSAVQDRNGFARAAATAMSPLEYAAVLSMILPIALTFALTDTTRTRWHRWLPALVIIAALAVSGSRSGWLGLALGIVSLLPFWSRQVRIRAAVASAAGLALLYLTVPGMLGTLRGLFLNTGSDPSITSRSSGYEDVNEIFSHSPILGRGFGTYTREYRILDNQYLLTVVELGTLGLLALVSLLVTGIVVAITARRWPPDALTRQLGPALAASVLAGAVLTAVFDAFSFRMAGGTLFLMLGLCGAYWRLAIRNRASGLPPTEADALSQPG